MTFPSQEMAAVAVTALAAEFLAFPFLAFRFLAFPLGALRRLFIVERLWPGPWVVNPDMLLHRKR
jgi:hypothetical protein